MRKFFEFTAWSDAGVVRWLSVLFCLLAILQVSTGWHLMNPDGISYLDMADRLSAGQLDPLAHPYWSPLYPVLLVPFQQLGSLLGWNAFGAAHALNLLIALLALVAFRWLVEIWLDALGLRPNEGRTGFVLLAYGLFFCAVFGLVTLSLVTPDLLVMVLVIVTAALTLRVTEGGESIPRYGHGLLLGAVLGLGYWAKTAMLPIAIILVGVLALNCWRKSLPWRIWGAMVCTLVAVTAPLVTNISVQLGEFSIGKTGSLNYAWFVAKSIDQPAASRSFLSEDPHVLDLRHTAPGTYPIHYDATVFTGGINPRFEPGLQTRTLIMNTGLFLRMNPTPWLALALLAFLTLCAKPTEFVFRPSGILLVWSASAIAVYLFVLVQPRYVAAFWLVCGLGFASALRASTHRVFFQGFVAALGACLIVQVTNAAVLDLGRSLRTRQASSVELVERQAQLLREQGLQDGDAIMYVGPSAFEWASYVSKHAGLRILAEVTNETHRFRFFSERSDLEGACNMFTAGNVRGLHALLASAGIKAVLIEGLGCEPAPSSWLELLAEGQYLMMVSDPV